MKSLGEFESWLGNVDEEQKMSSILENKKPILLLSMPDFVGVRQGIFRRKFKEDDSKICYLFRKKILFIQDWELKLQTQHECDEMSSLK